MLELFAFIGIILVLWYAQKFLSKASTFFYTLSEECFDYLAVMKRRAEDVPLESKQRKRKIAEVLQDIKETSNDLPIYDGETSLFYKDLGSGSGVLLRKKGST